MVYELVAVGATAVDGFYLGLISCHTGEDESRLKGRSRKSSGN